MTAYVSGITSYQRRQSPNHFGEDVGGTENIEHRSLGFSYTIKLHP